MLSFENEEKHQLIIAKGERLVESITDYAQSKKLTAGQITGLGALEFVELGYYDLHNKTYLKNQFNETDYELISLTGNISTKEKQSFVHVHAALSGPDFKVFGGHLFEATVAVTAEIFITPLNIQANRVYDENIGLHLICGFE